MNKILCDSCGAEIPRTRLIALSGYLKVPHPQGGHTKEHHDLDLCSAECVRGYAEALEQQEALPGGLEVAR